MSPPAAVIVGAGIIGCLIARELAARDPDVLITVLDRDAIGAGTSRRSAGLHLPRGATPRARRMSAASGVYYAGLRRSHPDLPIYPVGATVIGHSADGYLGEAAPVAADAPGTAAAKVTVPAGCRAWRIAGSHYADVYQLTQAIAARLRPRVRFAEGVAVTGLEPGADSVTVHTGTDERLVADRVVLAPGPWLGAPAWRELIAPLGLRVKKIVALHIGHRPDPADEALILDADDAFLLPLAHRGHWLFSFTCREWDVDPDTLPPALTPADLAAARACLRRYSPALADACDAGRVFCDAYGPDRGPMVRPLDPAGRIIFAGAASGSGYRLAPAIAAECTDLLATGLLTSGATRDYQYV